MTQISILSGLTRTHDIPAPNATQILVLNLMPNRAVTERQLASVFAAGAQPVALTFCLPATHRLRHHERQVRQHYPSFSQFADRHFDGLIVTGAPLDHLEFNQVDFWPEFQQILAWRKTHTTSALFICWGAYAAGTSDGVFTGQPLKDKISGVYTTDGLTMPQSRYFTIPLTAVHRGKTLAGSQKLGATLVEDPTTNAWYLTGHLEYQTSTLQAEYYRDYRKDPTTPPPANYLDAEGQPHNSWQADAVSLYHNWLNTITLTSEVNA